MNYLAIPHELHAEHLHGKVVGRIVRNIPPIIELEPTKCRIGLTFRNDFIASDDDKRRTSVFPLRKNDTISGPFRLDVGRKFCNKGYLCERCKPGNIGKCNNCNYSMNALCNCYQGDNNCGCPQINHSRCRKIPVYYADFNEQRPVVTIPTDDDNMKRFIDESEHSSGWKDSCRIYGKMVEVANNNGIDSVAELLSYLAEESSHHAEGIILKLCDIIRDYAQLRALLTKWFNYYNERRLQLLGLTLDEMDKSRLDTLELYDRCMRDPYSVASIPMKKAEMIVKIYNIRTVGDNHHSCGLILRKLYHNENERGWSYTPVSNIEIEHPDYPLLKGMLVKTYGVVTEYNNKYNQEVLYRGVTYNDQVRVSEYVKARLLPEGRPPLNGIVSGSRINPIIRPNTSAPLDELQIAALNMAIISGISIITGGPGTGKTFIIGEIVKQFDRSNVTYRLVSSTGKAVSRIRDTVVTEFPARTIKHMLVSPYDESQPGERRRRTVFDVLIIDEASMVTIGLLSQMFAKFGTDWNLILIGDPDQLPPIGCGSLLNELIKSQIIPHVRLINNHRVIKSGVNNDILNNITRISTWPGGRPFNFIINSPSNFAHIEGDRSTINNIIRWFKGQGFRRESIKVITPYNIDIQNINSEIQGIWNDNRPVNTTNNERWYVGDLIMCTENNYRQNVMNGEEGVITNIDNGIIKIRIGNREINVVSRNQNRNQESSVNLEQDNNMTTRDITLSYALTIHKSQGSEYDNVILYMPNTGQINRGFLQRNLIYTGISRAKKWLWHVGSIQVSSDAVGRLPEDKYEYLSNRLSPIIPAISGSF